MQTGPHTDAVQPGLQPLRRELAWRGAAGLIWLAWPCRALECTGTLIGTRHVLTAGHCVYDIQTTHKMVSSLDFAPGMNGHGRPNGVVQWQNVRILSQFQSQVPNTAHSLPSAGHQSTLHAASA